MKYSIIHEYNKELRTYFDALEETNPDVLEGLAVRNDFDGFVLELAMLGLTTLKKQTSE